jgi:YVTN family beta-propeller protein
MSELPSGTVTFLFTDIEGSTAMLKRLGAERYRAVLAEHHRILREAVERADGREIDTQGDSFFFAFRRARDAVVATIEAQRGLESFAWPEGLAVHVRMGLDTGEPTVEDDRYVGLGVHRTARIMAAGHGGQVLLSGTTRDLVGDELAPDETLRDLGERHLKDLDRPVRLYQLVAPGLRDTFPPLRTLDASRARRARRRVAGLLAGLLIAGIVLAAVLALGRTAGGSVAPNSVGVIDPSTNKVVKGIGVGTQPAGVSAQGGSVWVGNLADRTVSKIDARSRTLVHAIPLEGTPTGIAQGSGAVWVAEGPSGSLVRIDPQFDTVVATISHLAGAIRVSGGPSGSVAVGGGSVWAAYGSSNVARIDPATNHRVANAYAGYAPAAIAYGEGATWVANSTSNTVSRISPETNQKVLDISVGRDPNGVTVGAGYVWVSDTGDNAVSRVDPRSESSTTIPVGSAPLGIAYGGGAVWVANSKSGTVSRIDAATGRVVATIRVGGSPVGIATGDGLVWVTVQAG